MSRSANDTIAGGAQTADGGQVSADTIDRIVHFHDEEIPVVSVYLSVPLGEDWRSIARTKADSLVHDIRALLSSRSLEHAARVSVREDVHRIGERVRSGPLGPGTLALFSASAANLFEAIELPRLVRDGIVVDGIPWVRPMLAVLDEYLRCCVLVLDSESAHVWELYLGTIRDRGDLKVHDRDWRSRRGLSRRVDSGTPDELAKRHFRAFAGALDELFGSEHYDGLIVGGHDHELPGILDRLPTPLQGKVLGTFSIDPRTAGMASVREPAQAILDRHVSEEHRHKVKELLGSSEAGGLAARGLDACLWAGSVSAVAELFVEDGAVVPGVVCERRDWLARHGQSCPVCGAGVRQTADVINELANKVIDEGGMIHHVQAGTVLQEDPAIAALRFPLPPSPHDSRTGTP